MNEDYEFSPETSNDLEDFWEFIEHGSLTWITDDCAQERPGI